MADGMPYTPATPEEHLADIQRARREWSRAEPPPEPRGVKLSEATMDEVAASIPRRRAASSVVLTDDNGEAA